MPRRPTSKRRREPSAQLAAAAPVSAARWSGRGGEYHAGHHRGCNERRRCGQGQRLRRQSEVSANEFLVRLAGDRRRCRRRAAGVGVSLAVGVNASTTKAKIGDYARNQCQRHDLGSCRLGREPSIPSRWQGAGSGSRWRRGHHCGCQRRRLAHRGGHRQHAKVNQDNSFANAAQSSGRQGNRSRGSRSMPAAPARAAVQPASGRR